VTRSPTPRFRSERGDPPQFLFDHADLPEPQLALLELPAYVAATRPTLGPPHAGPWAGQPAVALFGDEPLAAARCGGCGRDGGYRQVTGPG
jgi:hypothetical protein